MTRDKEMFVICECGIKEHMFALTHWDIGGNEEELYLSVHLFHWENFFRRILVAVKYIFGYRCRYGEWDEVRITREKASENAKDHSS